MSTVSATWPEGFVYVCSATAARIVNTTPVSSAGADRIAAVVIFCGAADPMTEDSNTRSEALIPAEELAVWLARESKGRLSADNGTIVTLYGDPSEVSLWQTRMGQVLERFPPPQPVVFNVKGGVTEMTLGGLTRGVSDPRFIAITCGGQPMGTEQISPGTQRALPVTGAYPGIADYLNTYGYAEVRPRNPRGQSPRQRWQNSSQRQQRRLSAFAEALYHAPDIIAACNRIGAACFTTPRAQDRDFKPHVCRPDPMTTAALALLDGLPGLGRLPHEPSAWRIESIAAARILMGKWLEAALYLEARRRLKGFNDVEIAAGVQITAPGGKDLLAEIDLAVLIRGQLQLVEVKTTGSRSARGADGSDRSFSQFDSIRRLLIGQVGKAFFVNPRILKSPLIEARARTAGVEVVLGPDAVGKVVDQLVALAESRRD